MEMEMENVENNPSQFCQISGNWGMLGIPNLAGMFQIKKIRMLQNFWFMAFSFLELIRENQKGGKTNPHPD